MATPLKPGVPTAVFAKLDAEFQQRGRIALAPVADAIKNQAKINASNGSHRYGTPTPSSGAPTGPARISGTLVSAIDRTPVVRIGRGWQCQVGLAPGKVPPYGRRPANRYGAILELEGAPSGVRYPFLYPAAYFGFDIAAPVIYREMYGSRWTRLA